MRIMYMHGRETICAESKIIVHSYTYSKPIARHWHCLNDSSLDVSASASLGEKFIWHKITQQISHREATTAFNKYKSLAALESASVAFVCSRIIRFQQSDADGRSNQREPVNHVICCSQMTQLGHKIICNQLSGGTE